MDTLIFAANSVLPIILVILLGYWLRQIGFYSKAFLRGTLTVENYKTPLQAAYCLKFFVNFFVLLYSIFWYSVL